MRAVADFDLPPAGAYAVGLAFLPSDETNAALAMESIRSIVGRFSFIPNGGILALTALLPPRRSTVGASLPILVGLGIFGSSLLYGDGMITPAISVLGAVEGLEVVTPLFAPYVVPISVVILVALFVVQQYGTHRVGVLFGPVMVVWFLVIAGMGIHWIVLMPSVLSALNPIHAATFFRVNGFAGAGVLGSVFLAVTGGEALYADLGHFGRKPIQSAWICLVLPALLLNYFGQGALVLAHPEAIENPFYRLVPEALLLPMVILATAATVIASQAVITGAYSLVRQAIQLGLLPRLTILHTSASHVGQIYIPRVTVSLLIGAWASKRAGESKESYFLSGRNLPWWLLAASLVATTFSTDTPNLVTDIVYTRLDPRVRLGS